MNSLRRHFAIFGDAHGHLRLMFQLCRHWQVNTQTKLDGVLICGDLGFFPDLTRLDKATRKYIERDPEEAGFAFYFRQPLPAEQDPQLDRTLHGAPDNLNTVDCPVIFCHGNHEDFEELQKITRGTELAPVDYFERIYLLRSGEMTELAGLRIAALGGSREDREAAEAPVLGPRVSARAASRARRKTFDVLLSHVAPDVAMPGAGSRLITEVIHRCQPAYCFYAHHSRCIDPVTVGRTQCFYHSDVNFQCVRHQYQGPPEPGCMAILSWTGSEDHQYAVVDDPWFRAITGQTWQYL